MSADKLDPRLVSIFESELRFQVRQVQHGLAHANTIERGPDLNIDEFWFGMNAALNAMAGIGNILWPRQDRRFKGIGGTTSSSQRRGELLRKELGVADQATQELHDVRNGFVHYDERVDRWFVASENKAFVDRCIGGDNGFAGMPATAFARHFNPDTDEVSVFGVSVNFRKAVAEVESLGKLLHRREVSAHPMTPAAPES